MGKDASFERRSARLASVHSFVCCSRCESKLDIEDAGYRCRACDARFPSLGNVPCLLPDPPAARVRWRNQLALIHQEGESTIRTFEQQAARPALLPKTVERLHAQVALTQKVMGEIDELLIPAVGEPRDPSGPVPRFNPLETVHLAHRDWSWPESEENDRALAHVEEALVAPLGDVLVLGAGAGRLSYDLSRRSGTKTVVSVDIDPLVLLVAERLFAGDSMELTEPRANAVDLKKLSAIRTLRAPHGASPNVIPLLANGTAPPVKAHAFDTVLTPWFTDLIPDLRRFIGEVVRALKPGGRWVHFGPLLYPIQRPGAERFSQDELFELLDVAGFERESFAQRRLEYAFSPLTGRGRIEPCMAFSARQAGPPKPTKDGLPPWLVLPHLPVPVLEGASPEGPGELAIAELIDGQRTLLDVTRIVGERAGRHPPALIDGVRACVQRMHSSQKKFNDRS